MKKILFFISIISFVFLSFISFGQALNGEISVIQNVETGELDAVVKNIMAQTGITDPAEAVRMMNDGELQISVIKPKRTIKDGIIYLTLISDGTSGKDWIARLESKGYRLSKHAKDILLSKDFKTSKAGTVYQIAILKGELFNDGARTTKGIREEAEKRKFTAPNAEVACLIREKFSDKELEAMGLYWIVVMHESIKDSDDNPRLLGARRYDDGSWLNASYGNPDYGWGRDCGFAFVVSQVSYP